jgi:hypothetical protein
MTNIFSNIINADFKNLYNQAIDAILADNSLTVPCSVFYDTPNDSFCNNCLFDPINNRSLNIYNSTGPAPFPENSICSICNGYGKIEESKSEIIYLAVIFDSKYWLNWDYKAVKIQDGMVQTLCKIELLPKIRNAQYMTMDTNIQSYTSYTYSLAGDPTPCGLGNNKYIISMWSRA